MRKEPFCSMLIVWALALLIGAHQPLVATPAKAPKSSQLPQPHLAVQALIDRGLVAYQAFKFKDIDVEIMF